MSYCRWSSLDFGCDLYAYESADGYVIHVAELRVVGIVPPLLPFEEPFEEWNASYDAQHAFLAAAERVPIGLPCDGETFTECDLEDFAVRLLELQAMGYRFPSWVLEDIAQEMEQEATP